MLFGEFFEVLDDALVDKWFRGSDEEHKQPEDAEKELGVFFIIGVVDAHFGEDPKRGLVVQHLQTEHLHEDQVDYVPPDHYLTQFF
jgi:hypothetical protein